jgi:hypothetical protein
MKILIKCPQYGHDSAHILYQYVITCYHYLLLGDRLLYNHWGLHERVVWFDWQDGGL